MPITAMTTKDIVYLALIALAALVFYCHGFFSGVNRSRRLYESLLGGAEPSPDESWPEDDAPSRHRATTPRPPPTRGPELHGDFGNN